MLFVSVCILFPLTMIKSSRICTVSIVHLRDRLKQQYGKYLNTGRRQQRSADLNSHDLFFFGALSCAGENILDLLLATARVSWYVKPECADETQEIGVVYCTKQHTTVYRICWICLCKLIGLYVTI